MTEAKAISPSLGDTRKRVTSVIFMGACPGRAGWNDLFAFVDFDQQGHKAGQVVKRLRRLAFGQAGGGVMRFKRLDKSVQTQIPVLCSRH